MRAWWRAFPLRLSWVRWRLRKQPVPVDGESLDSIDAGLWETVLEGYQDTAGTKAVAGDEQIAEALVSDEGAE